MLIGASANGHEAVVASLIEKGANLDLKDKVTCQQKHLRINYYIRFFNYTNFFYVKLLLVRVCAGTIVLLYPHLRCALSLLVLCRSAKSHATISFRLDYLHTCFNRILVISDCFLSSFFHCVTRFGRYVHPLVRSSFS